MYYEKWKIVPFLKEREINEIQIVHESQEKEIIISNTFAYPKFNTEILKYIENK